MVALALGGAGARPGVPDPPLDQSLVGLFKLHRLNLLFGHGLPPPETAVKLTIV